MQYSTATLTLLSLLTPIIAHPAFVIEQRAPPVSLGIAASWGAIAATTLTSTGGTLIKGNCGTWPGTAITGFPPGECTGTNSAGGVEAEAAKADCQLAYTAARASGPSAALPAADLGGEIITPGVYTFPTSAATLTGSVTLNGTGQYIFLIDTTFGTAAGSMVELIGGAEAKDVFYVVGSSATIGAATQLSGNILAYTSVAVAAAASNDGTFCALNGAVTLINDALTATSV